MNDEISGNREAEKEFAEELNQELADISKIDAGMPKNRIIHKRICCIEEGLIAESTRINSGIYDSASISSLKGRMAVALNDIQELQDLYEKHRKMSGSYPIEYIRNIRLASTNLKYFENRITEDD